MNSSTSLTLLVRVQNRADREAWGRFSQIYGGMIGKWLRSQHVQASDADDIGQETLVVVLQELPKFQHNGRPGAFRRWIRLILAHRCREFYRRRQRQQRLVVRQIEQLGDGLERDECASQRWEQEHDAFCPQALDQVTFLGKIMTAFRRIVLDRGLEAATTYLSRTPRLASPALARKKVARGNDRRSPRMTSGEIPN
jgi:DNA-directed RNA polymerase specialized sigma24 family protein